jgi:Fur family ferric uptake transcriptional regulator
MSSQAYHLILSRGRPTPARVRVLDALLAAPNALTHSQLESLLADSGPLDRVTLYRVLEWLVDQGLAHKIAGEDRVWRFSAVAAGAHAVSHEHAHFQCTGCGKLFCLDDLHPVYAFSLPTGFHCQRVDLTLHGLCPHCSGQS